MIPKTPQFNTMFVLVALVSVLVGCSGSVDPVPASPAAAGADSAPQDGGTAVIGSISDVDSWNEYLSRQDFANKLHRRTHLRLASESPVGGPDAFEPQLAESWDRSEDGLAVSFNLRDASWSDGTPITAQDVRFTWQAQTSPEVAWIGAASKAQVTDVEVVDPHTVRFLFARDYPNQLADAVEGGILPRHVYGRVPFDQWHAYDWSAVSVGSGPFLLERHDAGHEIALRRNPHYFREGLPYLDRIVVRIVPDATNLLTQLKTGEIDYFEGLSPRDADRLTGNEQVELISFDYPKYDYVGWNGSRAPFDDGELRLALTLAIDREALVEDLLYGYGRVSKGPVLSSSWGASEAFEPWPYDPERARQILADKGYRVKLRDGTEAAEGRLLEFELITNAGNRLREAMAVKIQEQLGRVGVDVKLRTMEMKALVSQCSAGDYDAYLGGWTLFGSIDLKPVFGSDSNPPRGANVVFYESAEVDRLLARVEQVADWDSMKPLLDGIQQEIHQEQPYTFLYETKRVAAVGPRLTGMRIDLPTDPLARLEQARLGS